MGRKNRCSSQNGGANHERQGNSSYILNGNLQEFVRAASEEERRWRYRFRQDEEGGIQISCDIKGRSRRKIPVGEIKGNILEVYTGFIGSSWGSQDRAIAGLNNLAQGMCDSQYQRA